MNYGICYCARCGTYTPPKIINTTGICTKCKHKQFQYKLVKNKQLKTPWQ